MSDTDDDYTSVILEQIRDQNKAVLEAVGDMQVQVAKISGIEESVNELKADVKIIKVAVTDQGKQLQDHEQRIGSLEAAH